MKVKYYEPFGQNGISGFYYVQVPTFEVNDLGELREPFAHLVGISEVISGQATGEEEWVEGVGPWWFGQHPIKQ